MQRTTTVFATTIVTCTLLVASAQARDISGAAFHPNSSFDASFITYAVGAVTNFDSQSSHEVVADLGTVEGPGNVTFTVNVYGVSNGFQQSCFVTRRDIQTGNALETQFITNDSGLVTYKASFTFPPGTLNSSVSVRCQLARANANGQSYIYGVFFHTGT